MNLPLLVVDIGNSLTKVGRVVESSAGRLPLPDLLVEFVTGQLPPRDALAGLPPGPHRWRVVSVHREGQRLLEAWVREHRLQDDWRVLAYTDLPLVVQVDFPERVGMDRLAAAVAANRLREPGRGALVVCAGTAVTVNLIDEQGAFVGGAILPGFRLQAEALYGGADLLPLALVAPHSDPPQVLGKNTEAAIQSGLFWGSVGAVRELVARLSQQLSAPPHIVVTGGDLTRLAPLVNDQAQFVPSLVLAGIALSEQGMGKPSP